MTKDWINKSLEIQKKYKNSKSDIQELIQLVKKDDKQTFLNFFENKEEKLLNEIDFHKNKIETLNETYKQIVKLKKEYN